MTMTKKEILLGVLECEKILNLDYHSYIKSDYFNKSMYDNDFYSVWLSQRYTSSGLLHHILLYANGIDASYYRTIDTEKFDSIRKIQRDIKPIPYREFTM